MNKYYFDKDMLKFPVIWIPYNTFFRQRICSCPVSNSRIIISCPEIIVVEFLIVFFSCEFKTVEVESHVLAMCPHDHSHELQALHCSGLLLHG